MRDHSLQRSSCFCCKISAGIGVSKRPAAASASVPAKHMYGCFRQYISHLVYSGAPLHSTLQRTPDQSNDSPQTGTFNGTVGMLQTCSVGGDSHASCYASCCAKTGVRSAAPAALLSHPSRFSTVDLWCMKAPARHGGTWTAGLPMPCSMLGMLRLRISDNFSLPLLAMKAPGALLCYALA